AIDHLGKEKGIDKEVLLEALEAALISAYKKNFKSKTNVRVDLDESTHTMRLFSRKTAVAEVDDPHQEISLEEAEEIDLNDELVDMIAAEVTPENVRRLATHAARQDVTQRGREAERSVIYGEFVDRDEDVMTGIIQRTDRHFVYVNLGKIEGKLAKSEQ